MNEEDKVDSKPDAELDALLASLGDDDDDAGTGEEDDDDAGSPATRADIRALNDQIASIKDAAPAAPPKAEAEPEKPSTPVQAPANETPTEILVRQSFEAEEAMLDDIRAKHSGLNESQIKEIRGEIRKNWPMASQIIGAKGLGYHLKIADSYVGNLASSGSYIPPALRSQMAPVYTEAPVEARKLDAQTQESINEINGIIAQYGKGEKLSKDDLEASVRYATKKGEKVGFALSGR